MMVHSNPSRDLCGDVSPRFPLAEGSARAYFQSRDPPRDSIPRFVQAAREGGGLLRDARWCHNSHFAHSPVISFRCASFEGGAKGCHWSLVGGGRMSARWKVGRRGEFGLHTRRCIRQIFGEEGPAGSPRSCTVLRRPSGCASSAM